MKKRVVTALLAAILILPLGIQTFPGINTVYAATGSEQEIPEDYTPIYDIADLYAIRNNLSGNYILMNDIDMTADTSKGGDYDCGTGWDSIEEFNGVLDGNGHRIIGMHIFGEFSSDAMIGLFENFHNASILNLGMVDCDINVTINRNSYIGTLSGIGDGSVSNCYADGKIVVASPENAEGEIGGLIGGVGYPAGHHDTIIQECYNACEVDGENIAIGEDENSIFLGGICGKGCYYSNGGSSEIRIKESYNIGNIKGKENTKIGSLCGNMGYDNYENCQYLKGTAQQGIGDIEGVIPDIGAIMSDSNCVILTEAQMKNEKLFTGYDFTDTWEIDPYCSYPYPQFKNNRMIRVKSINLKTPPSKLTYNQGEDLSINGSVLEVTYEDGIKTSVPLSLDMLTDYDMMQIGTQRVTVTYGGVKTNFSIEVKEIPVSSIAIPETLSIYRSKEQRLTPTILPDNATDKSVAWESSDPSIASVDNNGLVKAKANGTAIITATSSNGLTSRCTVTVLVPAVSVQLSQTSLTLKEGESRNITAQALPLECTDTVKWRSGNSAVAEVYDGLIIAKKAGTAVVTAYTDSGAQAACTVTVQNPVTVNPGSNGGSGGNPNNNAALIKRTTSAKAKIKSAKNSKSKSLTLKLSGLSDCDGYQIQYGLKKNFKGAKSITKKTSSVTVKKLKAKKTYYVRARVYKKIAGTTYYGKWSSRKSVKIKK